ncbi:MAG: cyanoexosortase A system-associated protein [Cyanobacteria bacterium P01_F01_bin.86]
MRFTRLVYQALLISTFGGVLFVLISVLLFPLRKAPSFATTFTFPNEALTLENWTPQNNQIPASPASENSSLVAAKQYRYHQDRYNLDLDIRYLINTSANLPKLLQRQIGITPSLITQHHEKGVGFYGLFTTEEKTYLSACINSRGASSLTKEQFAQNRLLHDLHPSWSIPWLLGQNPLTDRRCLWTTLSIPLEDLSPEEAYPLLESAWIQIYDWWAPRFPES